MANKPHDQKMTTLILVLATYSIVNAYTVGTMRIKNTPKRSKAVLARGSKNSLEKIEKEAHDYRALTKSKGRNDFYDASLNQYMSSSQREDRLILYFFMTYRDESFAKKLFCGTQYTRRKDKNQNIIDFLLEKYPGLLQGSHTNRRLLKAIDPTADTGVKNWLATGEVIPTDAVFDKEGYNQYSTFEYVSQFYDQEKLAEVQRSFGRIAGQLQRQMKKN